MRYPEYRPGVLYNATRAWDLDLATLGDHVDKEGTAYTQGRLMLGSFGDSEKGPPSVGNAAHRGEFRPHFGDSSFCASCHTVAVEDPVTKDQVVTLQDTYREWLEGSKNKPGLNWSELNVNCMDCHSRDLTRLVKLASKDQHDIRFTRLIS